MKTTPDGETVGGLSFIAGVYFFYILHSINPNSLKPYFFFFNIANIFIFQEKGFKKWRRLMAPFQPWFPF